MSPVVGRETAMNAIKAVLIASIFIIIYVAIRFEFRFAVSAVLALLYDVMFVVGTFALFSDRGGFGFHRRGADHCGIFDQRYDCDI